MKHICLFVCLIYFTFSNVIGQTRLTNFHAQKQFSIEFDINYNYYFLGDTRSNQLNEGFSFLGSTYIRKLKLSTGVNYCAKHYNEQGDPFFSIEKRAYDALYLNFPIIANIELSSKRNFASSLLLGLAFNQIIDYKIKSYYINGTSTIETNLLKNRKLGAVLMIGTTFSKPISSRFQINFSPMINYKLILNSLELRPDYKNIPDDRLAVGFKMGIEFLFKTNKHF